MEEEPKGPKEPRGRVGASGRLSPRPPGAGLRPAFPGCPVPQGLTILRMFNLCSKHFIVGLARKVHLGFSVASYGGIQTNVWVDPVDGPGTRGLCAGSRRKTRGVRAEPGTSSLLGFPHWLPGGLRLEGRLLAQIRLETVAPVTVMDAAVLLRLADGCPLSGEHPVALVPSLSSRWVRGPPKSGTLSQAPPRAGKASSGVCTLPGVARVLEAFCSSRGCGPGTQGDRRVCKGGSASHRVFLENAIPERL